MNVKEYATEQIRNIVVVGHNGTGKTSLTEAMLFVSGAITRLGKVDEGTTTTDFDPDEIKRKITINATLAPCDWKKTKINIIDTPGYADFIGEVKGSMRVADTALVVINASSGVEVETEKVWAYADEYAIPRIAFITKMDRERADFFSAIHSISETFKMNTVPISLPIGKEQGFRGVINLLKMKAELNENGKIKEAEIPADLMVQAQEYKEKLIEAAAEADDELTMKYLDGQALTPEEIQKGLVIGIRQRKFIPVLCGAAVQTTGVATLLDFIVDYLPSPAEMPPVKGINPESKKEEERPCKSDAPLCAFVYKTIVDPFAGRLSFIRVYSGILKSDSIVYNVNKGKDEKIANLFWVMGKQHAVVHKVVAGDIAACSKLAVTTTSDTFADREHPIMLPATKFPDPVIMMAIEAKTQGDEEKISNAIHRLTEEDQTLSVRRDTETRQTIISGMGDLHLNIVLDRMKTKFGVDAELTPPKIAYRETIRTKAEAQGKYKRQSGGRGQYGDVWLRLEPLPRGKGYEFVNEIFGGVVPSKYIPSVEKGLQEALQKGVLSGSPVTDLRITLYDGSYHEVDSSDMAFKIAASIGFKKAMELAKPVILEPIVEVEVTVPEQYMGDIIGDINAKRGQIMGVDSKNGKQVIKALVPLAEMSRYAIDLRSIARGRGSYTMKFSHYQETPPEVSQKIIAARKPEAAEEEET
ncbi:MAG: elongation factor G [bacterium]|nr:elongation factor G [bacterium]